MQPSEFNDSEITQIANEFRRLEGKCYLDHAGATLYSEQQIASVARNLQENIYTSPHTSKATEDLIDQVRYRVLRHFNTDNSHYDVVFTSGATASLKTVAQCFDFGNSGVYSYVQENHTSVLGMRESVDTPAIYVITRNQLLENVEQVTVKAELVDAPPAAGSSNNLITLSAQCNFSGFKYPLEIINKIQRTGLKDAGTVLKRRSGNEYTYSADEGNSWFVCLDAAAFAGTNYLDLSKYKPDFVCISFYKIFGYPTGLGALLVSKRGQNVLRKSYYGGGTVKIAMSKMDFHVKRDSFHERFEDGTLPFLSIISLLAGFNTIDRLIGAIDPMKRISRYVFQLARYGYNELKKLTYSNGRPLVKFYAHTEYDTAERQGAVISFNLLQDAGSYIGYAEVACMASIYNIVLRTGCFCNPGACQVLLKLSDGELQKHFQAGHICGDYNDLVDGLPTGAVRISFGYMTRQQDIDTFIVMLTDCYLKGRHAERYQILEKSSVPGNLLHIRDRLRVSDQKIRLKQICIYPIKSCGAFKINDRWELTAKGFKYDRCWMIVNGNGVAVTQKINTKLCLVRPEINLQRGVMILHYPGFDRMEIPLHPPNNQIITSSLCQSKVCGDFVEGLDCGDKVANWLSDCLDLCGLRLIQQYDGTQRLSRNGTIKDISLSNQAQFLLINYTSVAWLAGHVDEWLDVDGNDIDGIVDRFRGNLIIETADPLDETNLEMFRIGSTDFRLEGQCTRCQMICIDPRTGEKTAEPLRTIAKLFEGKLRFGVYLSQANFDSSKTNSISCSEQVIVK